MLPSLVGRNVIVRTVTYHYTGRLVAIEEGFLHLADAAWIADSGRWARALADGTLSEVEPYPDDVYVAVGSVVDITAWSHELPRDTK